MNIDLSVYRKGKKKTVIYYPRVVLKNGRPYAPVFVLPNRLKPSTLKNRLIRYKKDFYGRLKLKGLDEKEIKNLWKLFCEKIRKRDNNINITRALRVSKIYKYRYHASHRPEILRSLRRPGKTNKKDKLSRILHAQLRPAFKIKSEVGTGFINLSKQLTIQS